MTLTERLEVAVRQIGRIDNIMLVAASEPPGEARSWADEHGIEIVVSSHVKPGTMFLVNPGALRHIPDEYSIPE